MKFKNIKTDKKIKCDCCSWESVHGRCMNVWSNVQKRDRKTHRCIVCHKYNAEGHHLDYSRPEEVVWLCGSCHRKVHMGLIDASHLRFRRPKNQIILSDIPTLANVYHSGFAIAKL